MNVDLATYSVMAEQTEHKDLSVRRDGGNVLDGRQVAEQVVEPKSGSSRCYHVLVLFMLLMVLLANIESLVLFGTIHVDVNNSSSWTSCILFAESKDLISSPLWSCYSVLGGQLALTILLVLSAIIYLILIKSKVKMLAGVRAVDMVGSFAFAIIASTIFAIMFLGLQKTCISVNKASKEKECKIEGLISFYTLISVSMLTMLGIAIFFLLSFIWNFVLLILYTIKGCCCVQPSGEHVRSPLLHNNKNRFQKLEENPFTDGAHVS